MLKHCSKNIFVCVCSCVSVQHTINIPLQKDTTAALVIGASVFGVHM